MIKTAQELLEEYPSKLYDGEEKSWREYKMALGDFFKLSDNFKGFGDFKIQSQIHDQVSTMKRSGEYKELEGEIKSASSQMSSASQEERAEIRKRVKALKALKVGLSEKYNREAEKRFFGECEKLTFIEYKSTLALNSFKNICYFAPKLNEIKSNWLRSIPLFTKNIEKMPSENIAIEAGPCMFGSDEVTAKITLKSGEVYEFDCNSGKSANSDADMIEFVSDRGADIADIDYIRLKQGITAQEFEYFDAMFEFAQALKAPLLISIPDMSYLKYFRNTMIGMEEQTTERCYAKYKKVLYEISDMYLDYIDKYQKRYNLPVMDVLHNRNQELINIFYEKRERFLQMKNISSNSLKLDSIRDYISMPAMPYYLWGIKNIVEINSTDETDAIRKCMKNHKGVVNFFPIMIPEKVSRDGKTTIFEANRQLKDYVR